MEYLLTVTLQLVGIDIPYMEYLGRIVEVSDMSIFNLYLGCLNPLTSNDINILLSDLNKKDSSPMGCVWTVGGVPFGCLVWLQDMAIEEQPLGMLVVPWACRVGVESDVNRAPSG